MKSIKYLFANIITALLICFVMFGVCKVVASADNGEDPYVIVTSYEVLDGVACPGDDFDIKICIKNVDSVYTAQNVMVSVVTTEGINVVYPSVPQVFVGNMGPNEQRELIFSYKLSKTYSVDSASFYTTIASDGRNNSVILSIPVELDTAAFTVLSKNVPVESEADSKISASFYFRVRQDVNLSNVQIFAYVDGAEVVSSTIGNMRQNASKTQNLFFSISELGRHNLLIKIEGIDQNGAVNTLDVYNGDINIIEKTENKEVIVDDEIVNMRSQRDILIMAISIIGIVIFTFGIVVVIRKNK